MHNIVLINNICIYLHTIVAERKGTQDPTFNAILSNFQTEIDNILYNFIHVFIALPLKADLEIKSFACIMI
jgi:hypothetical protein